jgi:Zn-dependent peptidase ImmA (M78 family)
MKRGFKSFAESISVEVRKEMGIPAHGRLCSFQLAEHLGVPTIGFSKLAAGAKALGVTARQLEALHKEVHGMSVPLGVGNAILYNDSNGPARQQSDIAHEAAHILLRHPLADIISGAITIRTKELEEEAIHLGGVLLLPLPAALHILRQRKSVNAAAEEYGISAEMITYRCNISGARQIHARSGSRY